MNATAAQSVEESPPVVLLIDDSPAVHRLLRARLRHEPMRLLSAIDGAEGLRLARSCPPAAVLLDVELPGVDGFQVLRALREDPETLHTPVLVLSGLASAQDKVTAFELGAMDYVTKPFSLTELRVRLRSALRLSALVRMLAQRAQIDGLTGLWNRAHFERRWAAEVAGASRHGRALSLAMLDIDHFKSINDTFGHPAGDAVLQGLARLLERECRHADVAFRYGGEEFALILPDTPPRQAEAACERIRVALRSLTWARHPERRVTASFGIAGSARPMRAAPAEWLEAADRSLYEAKRGGRDRVVTREWPGAATAPAAQKGKTRAA